MIFWVLFVHTKSTRGVRGREALGVSNRNGSHAPKGEKRQDFCMFDPISPGLTEFLFLCLLDGEQFKNPLDLYLDLCYTVKNEWSRL